MLKRFFSLLTLLLLLSGCINEVLTVHTDYISHQNLASTYIGTPDPLLHRPLVGQRLVISWRLPPKYKTHESPEVRVFMRYGDRSQASFTIPLTSPRGWHVYSLANEEYFEKNGIKAYLVQLYAGGELVDEWQHQLWVNLIEFADDTEETDADDDDLHDDFDSEGEDLDLSYSMPDTALPTSKALTLLPQLG